MPAAWFTEVFFFIQKFLGGIWPSLSIGHQVQLTIAMADLCSGVESSRRRSIIRVSIKNKINCLPTRR